MKDKLGKALTFVKDAYLKLIELVVAHPHWFVIGVAIYVLVRR